MATDNERLGMTAGSLRPELFDMIEYNYPDDVTVLEIYSYTNKNGMGRYVTAIIQNDYSDATHCRILKRWRQDLVL